jgi:hypothetical protein
VAEITLQLHDYRMEALEEVMEERGTSVEKFCQDALIELYCSEVPFEKQREIQERIDGKRGRTESPVSESPPPKPDPPIESVRPLRAEDMEFHDDVLRFHNFLNFKFVPNPALCEAFGVGDNIEEPGALVSVYANFDMAAGRPAETLNVTLTVDESVSVDGAADYQYRMSAEELAALSQKMDAYYQKKRGVSLAERTREYAEEKSGKTDGAAVSGQKRRKASPER